MTTISSSVSLQTCLELMKSSIRLDECQLRLFKQNHYDKTYAAMKVAEKIKVQCLEDITNADGTLVEDLTAQEEQNLRTSHAAFQKRLQGLKVRPFSADLAKYNDDQFAKIVTAGLRAQRFIPDTHSAGVENSEADEKAQLAQLDGLLNQSKNQSKNCMGCGKSEKLIKTTLKICSICKSDSDWYCSKECQVTDWPLHRIFCVPKDQGAK